MSDIKDRIEKRFERLARVLYRNPLKVLFACCLFIGSLSYQISNLTINTSTEAMLFKDDPIITEYKAFQEQFGRDEMIIIAIQASDIFCDEFLVKLKSLHHDIKQEVPYIEKISSLINARNVRSKGDLLEIHELFSDWPEKQLDLSLIKDQVLRNPFWVNMLVSQDVRFTAIVVEMGMPTTASYSEEDLISDLSEESFYTEEDAGKLNYLNENERREVVGALKKLTSRYEGPEFKIALSGSPILTDAYNRAVVRDISLLAVVGLLVVGFFLWLLFRRLSGIILPAVVIISSFNCSLGLMAILDMPVTLMTPMLTSLLAAVGVADAIHILSIFYQQFQQGKNKADAIALAVGHSGLPVVLTTLTTAVGLLSFTFAELTVIAQLGVYAAFGVIMALLFTIVLIPPLLALIPVKQKLSGSEKKQTVLMDRILLSFARCSTAHPYKILGGTFAIWLLTLPFIFQINFGFNLADYFPDTGTAKKDLALIDDKLKGAMTLEVIVDTKEADGIKDPELLNKIEILADGVRNMEYAGMHIGKVMSINDIIKEIHRALNGNDQDFYLLPMDKGLVSQEIFLFQNSGARDLQRFVDNLFSKTRITIKTTWADANVFVSFIQDIQKMAKSLFGDRTEIRVTGLMALATRALNAAILSMARGYMYAFLAISLLMILLVWNFKIGLIAMIPNLLPIFLIVGIMGYFGIPFDILTIMIGCVAIGLVVDDTMHFIYNFQKYYERTGDVGKAVGETMLTTGRAMLITSIILCSSFFATMLGSLKSTTTFGCLTGITVILALLADFLVAPALMVLVNRRAKIF